MRYKRDSFLIEGLKNSYEALKADQKLSTLYFSGEVQNNLLDRTLDLADKKQIQIRKIPHKDLEQVSTLVNPEGIICIGKLTGTDKQPQLPRNSQALFLYQINDPGNLGTILRTAAWFGLSNIILSRGAVDPYNPKVIRASMGGIFHSKIFRNIDFQEIFEVARKNDLRIIAADMSGKNINRLSNLPDNFILCMGSESHGLPESIMSQADQILSIPRPGKGESLNLAISTGILIKDLMISQ